MSFAIERVEGDCDEEKDKKKIRRVLLIPILAICAIAVPAMAENGNFARSWETLAGAQWHGYIQIQDSFWENGKHAKRGYHRFMRKAGPSLDTGRMYTKQSKSPKDSNFTPVKALFGILLYGEMTMPPNISMDLSTGEK